jgi:hypothetical protein
LGQVADDLRLFEGGDTYAAEVKRYGLLVAADPLWQEAHGTRLMPTPEEYLTGNLFDA